MTDPQTWYINRDQDHGRQFYDDDLRKKVNISERYGEGNKKEINN